MSPAIYSNSAGWTLIVAEHDQTDDIDEIADALEGKIPNWRIDALIAIVRVDGYEFLTVEQVRALHDAEYVAPLADYSFVGLSADYSVCAWLVSGKLGEPHTVIIEDDDGNWLILEHSGDYESDTDSSLRQIGEAYATPGACLAAYRAQA